MSTGVTAKRGPYPFVDRGAVAVLGLTITVFVLPMILFWQAGATAVAGRGFELRALLWMAILSLVLPLVQVYLQIGERGGPAVRSNRATFEDRPGAGDRVARAHRNAIEALVPFALAVVAARLLGVSTALTVAASAMFLGARVMHAATYALGITVLRSAAFYAGSIATAVIVVQSLMAR